MRSCFGEFNVSCGNFFPLQNVPSVVIDPSNYEYICSWRGSAGTGEQRRSCQTEKTRWRQGFYQEAESLSIPVTMLHVLFIHAYQPLSGTRTFLCKPRGCTEQTKRQSLTPVLLQQVRAVLRGGWGTMKELGLTSGDQSCSNLLWGRDRWASSNYSKVAQWIGLSR